jgi:hypothetical protein
MAMSQGPATGIEALRQLAHSLKDPFFRKAFATDPQDAMSQVGIAPEAIPLDIMEALVELSPNELGALARVRKALEAVGVPDDIVSEMV